MYILSLTDIGSIAQRVPPDQGELQKQAEYISLILIHHCLHEKLFSLCQLIRNNYLI